MLIDLIENNTGNGSLIAINNSSIPFDIKRIFYIYDTNEQIRGNHGHKECSQLIICLKGILYITTEYKFKTKTYILNNNKQGLLLNPNEWISFMPSTDAIVLVLCSHEYDKTEYINEYEEISKIWTNDNII